MTLILSLLKSTFAVLGAVLLVVFLIVFFGPRFLIPVLGPDARLWCYLLAAVILIGFLVYLLIKKIREKKNAKMLEGFLNQQADDQLMAARPDVQDELAAIKEKLTRAIQILKKSRLARGRRGADALYVLPWYMIIGPSGCGKSTAIRNSGLHFPPVDADSADPGKIKGLGGTRNCDWWFSNEGIILDTAGRYTLSANIEEDREEWSNFLDMLKKARPRAPINGLILAISIDELLQKDSDGLEAHAKALRARIDELILKLEIIFPIYVVFTKCDLISGFVESFGDLSRSDREQVWGYTRQYGPARMPLHEEFEREVAALENQLKKRRLKQLAVELRPAQKQGMYLFPVEFRAIQPVVSAFIETLTRPNPYQQNPLLRGVYFTSGTQEGAPIAQVMAAMQREFSLAPSRMSPAEPVKETKAYFIRDLFQEVILPDETKVHPTTSAWKRRRFIRAVTMAGQFVATAALSAILLFSYVNNRSHNRRVTRVAERVAQATAAAHQFDLTLLDSLDLLREQLVSREDHIPLMSRWGLYSGRIVDRVARDVYFRRLHDILIAPTVARLADQLNGEINCEDTLRFGPQYASFLAYQMLTLPFDSIPQKPRQLQRRVYAAWEPDTPENTRYLLESLVEGHMNYYWKHRLTNTTPWLMARADRQLLAAVDAQVARCWTPHRLYQEMIDEINDKLGGDYTYFDAASNSDRIEGGSIGRAYTKAGWEAEVRTAIEQMPRTIAADPVKLEAFANVDENDIRTQLREFYIEDFIGQWKAFIESGHVRPFFDLQDAIAGTEELITAPSPLIRVLENVFEQSELIGLDGKRISRIETEFEALGRFLGRRKVDPDVEANKDKYLKQVETLPTLLQDIEQKLTGDAKCALNLKRFDDGLQQKVRATQSLLRGAGVARVCAAFLTRPMGVMREAAVAQACACLNREWKSKVLDQYQNDLAASYPFSPSAEATVSLSQADDFFNTTLKNFETREIDDARDYGLPISGEFNRAMTAAREIRTILSRGSEKLHFTLVAEKDGFSNIVKSMVFSYGNTPRWEYVFGTQSPREYKWPLAGDNSCEIRVDAKDGGVYFPPLRETEVWGIFKVMDKATKVDGYLSWKFVSRNGQTATIGLRLGGSDAGFIQRGHFTQFRCPVTVCP